MPSNASNSALLATGRVTVLAASEMPLPQTVIAVGEAICVSVSVSLLDLYSATLPSTCT